MEEVIGIRNGIVDSPSSRSLCHRCKWCYSLIWGFTQQIEKGNEENYFDAEELRNGDKVFCCSECKDEERDWNYLRHYKNNLEGQRRRDAVKREKRLLDKMK